MATRRKWLLSSAARFSTRPNVRASRSWRTRSRAGKGNDHFAFRAMVQAQRVAERRMKEESQQPIVIKRITRVAGGHHGGAWKIAYADFVTAMMAFFLLMWLLGSTAEGDLKGIADYFSTPLKVALSGGSGSGDSSSILKGGGTDLSRSGGQVKRGESPPRKKLSTTEGGLP